MKTNINGPIAVHTAAMKQSKSELAATDRAAMMIHEEEKKAISPRKGKSKVLKKKAKKRTT